MNTSMRLYYNVANECRLTDWCRDPYPIYRLTRNFKKIGGHDRPYQTCEWETKQLETLTWGLGLIIGPFPNYFWWQCGDVHNTLDWEAMTWVEAWAAIMVQVRLVETNDMYCKGEFWNFLLVAMPNNVQPRQSWWNWHMSNTWRLPSQCNKPNCYFMRLMSTQIIGVPPTTELFWPKSSARWGVGGANGEAVRDPPPLLTPLLGFHAPAATYVSLLLVFLFLLLH